MQTPTLEERVAALERAVVDLQREVAELKPKACREYPLTYLSVEELERRRLYFRQTGHEAPTCWNPSDPIPEPEWWGEEPPGEPSEASP